jgi:hypothetical protein
VKEAERTTKSSLLTVRADKEWNPKTGCWSNHCSNHSETLQFQKSKTATFSKNLNSMLKVRAKKTPLTAVLMQSIVQ